MMITTKSRYALRLMIALGCLPEGERASLRSIAEQTGISMKYLEQLAKSMVSEGLLVSTRGAHGGYALAKPARDITAGEIMRASEGSYAPVDCLVEGGRICPLRDECATQGFWGGLERTIDAYVDSVRLSNLVAQQRFINLRAEEDGQ